ncbi:gamma-glutamyltransferase family protein [Sphingomonas immobilis]|uniref:Gamma-glutamyltransferase family protein n=1 Tax=Sphingomonas immobilis TaxID=3063997 RepID=A0ABT8ZUP6_9SPHN|nr:gamma-glutamyltransferase family protein [Sphingomonas sp. CA1-15]MDO7840710.1 gamma-glutamyltransferase family protein [Sphingomonas sp. CA1-15]
MSLATVRGRHGMVTAPHFLAAEAGLSVLRDGGNAVEACVAVAAALAAVYPHMTGIGGDGFWVIREPAKNSRGRVHSVHGCGGAAANLSRYVGLTAMPTRGPLAACTVAGTISGWERALAETGGSLPLERLLRDAIRHAESGVTVTAAGAAIAAAKGGELRDQPGDYAKVFEPEGRPLAKGDLLRQPALAETLRALATDGLDGFYRGPLAEAIAADLEELGSPVTWDDLAAHAATRPEPLKAPWLGGTLYNTTPPTQGLASLLILLISQQIGVVPESWQYVHLMVEATKQAFIVRDQHVGDPAYMSLDPQALLDDPGAIRSMVQAMNGERALPWPQPPQWGDTCWFAAADGEGRVVSCIQSTYFEFGSGLVLPKTGIVWQNRGSSFRIAADGWNALKPGRKPFHTLNPALAEFDDGRVMAYGTMGGEGQPQTQAAVFTRYAKFGVDLQEAISRPRWLLGRTWGEQSTTLKIEDGFAPELYAALAEAGHDVERVGPLTATMGHAGAIVRHGDGALEGATDPRSDGGVAAW